MGPRNQIGNCNGNSFDSISYNRFEAYLYLVALNIALGLVNVSLFIF